jgi:hypothetical protein
MHPLLLALALALALALPLSDAMPPSIPSTPTARSLLDSLLVASWSWDGDYTRDKYGRGWKPVHGACNTRETVLQRDGEDVEVDPRTCAAVSGVWESPYEGGTWTDASDVDVDHVVPLSHSWKV